MAELSAEDLELIEYLLEEEGIDAVDLGPVPGAVAHGAELPLSFAQERLWVLDQLMPGSPLYSIPCAFRLRGPVAVSALRQATSEIVRRHDVLRSSYPAVEGQPRQRLADPGPIPLPVIDLRSVPAPDREAASNALLQREAQMPFDLAQGPLLRTALLRLRDDEHILLFNVHHIVFDGWSIGIFVRELVALYRAYLAGSRSPLPDLRLQYVDYTAWQRRWLQGETYETQLAYWRRQLADVPVLELPSESPRSPLQFAHGTTHRMALPTELAQRVHDVTRRHGVTLFMTLLGAFAITLSRWTGQLDIPVGTPIANRDRPGTEDLIGLFLNTLVLRLRLSLSQSFAAVLEHVRATASAAYSHQDIPFEKLVSDLQCVRDVMHNPLAQMFFSVQTASLDALELPGVSLVRVPLTTGTAKADLSLTLEQNGDQITGFVEYSTDLFDDCLIARFVEHYIQILRTATESPDTPLSDLRLLPVHEYTRIVDALNTPLVTYPHDICIHEIFEQQVAATPDVIAAVCCEIQITYRELDIRSNQLARYLRRCGVGPEVTVALYIDRSIEAIVALLAILKAGGCYLPIDRSYPEERLSLILKDAGVTILLTQAGLLEKERYARDRTVVLLDQDWRIIALERSDSPQSAASPDHLAYIMYTSGSTGQPKGSGIAHRSIIPILLWHRDHLALGERIRTIQTLSISFDFGLLELLCTILFGGAYHVVFRDVILAPDEYFSYIDSRQISMVFVTPSYLEAAIGTAPSLASMHVMVFGGEPLRVGIVRKVMALAGPECIVFNGYGPTEAGINCTMFPMTSARLRDDRRLSDQLDVRGRSIPIGPMSGNSRLFVLDRELNLVPLGVVGELYIAGIGLARGYLNRPALTAERFLPVPFGPQHGARMYRSGDLVHYHSDGSLEFHGRADEQIKVRGFRVELGEIQAALALHPAIEECAVISRADEAGGQQIVAYLVPRQPAPSIPELRTFLRAMLPDFMMPGGFVTLERVPMTTGGKLDRQALPAPSAVPATPEDGDEPAAEAERVLADIWSAVLQRDHVGVNDNFFHLGGDSILAIQVVARARQAGFDVAARHLFQYPTIAELVLVVGRTQPTVAEQDLVLGPVPLTPIQWHFFAVERREPHHFNQAVVLDLLGRAERWTARLVEEAMRQLVHHHDALRLRFVHSGGRWEQSIGTDMDAGVTLIDLSGPPASAVERAFDHSQRTLQGSLNLSAGPILRAALFRLPPGQSARLLLIAHHLVVDGLSWRILLEDLHVLCEQINRGEAPRLPAKTTSFKYWATRLLDYGQSDAVQGQAPYWMETVTRPVSRLPWDHALGPNSEASIHTISRHLSPEETRALLEHVPLAYNVQINDALLTALALVLADWTGERIYRVDLEGHGREEFFPEVDLSRTVGWFTALFPVILDITGAHDVGAALATVKEQLRAIPTAGIGYGLLCGADTVVARTLRHADGAEISFNYYGQIDQTQQMSGLLRLSTREIGPQRSLRDRRERIFDINCITSNGSLRVDWMYSRNLHRSTTIARLADGFLGALRDITSLCQQSGVTFTPSDFPAAELTQDELALFLARIGEGT